MPRPKAAWRFSARSMTTSSASLEELRVAVGGREGQQHPVVLAHRAAVELEVLDDQPGHRDRRVGPQQLLDRGRHQLGLGDEAARGRRGASARCQSDAPIALQVVSMPAISSSSDRAADVVRVERLAVDLGLEQVAR